VLVNRGWVAANPDRSILPDLSIDDSPREITGRLNRLPRPGIKLDAVESVFESGWPRRLLFPNAADLIDQIGYVVYDYQLWLDPDSGDGFELDRPPTRMPPAKHTAYAVQWFALAVTLLVIYFVVNRKAPAGPKSDD
jgi:surfeit locus 1 family protein